MNRSSELVQRVRSMFRRRKPDPSKRNPENPWIIIAMGNPGDEYSRTRHNVGWWVADLLRERLKADDLRNEGPSRIAHAKIGAQTAIIGYPLTYVNRTGAAARALVQKFGSEVARIIVITDDINLPVGKIRVRRGGGAGGHNGLKSMIDALSDDGFPRIRIGVGKQSDGDSQVDHVLGEPSGEEAEAIDAAVWRAANAVETIVQEGVEKAMNEFN